MPTPNEPKQKGKNNEIVIIILWNVNISFFFIQWKKTIYQSTELNYYNNILGKTVIVFKLSRF